MAEPTVEELLDISARASERVRTLSRLLATCTPGSPRGRRIYVVYEAACAAEKAARAAARAHPDYVPWGL